MKTYCIYDDEYGLGIKRSESPLDNDEDHYFCQRHLDVDDEAATSLEHMIVDFDAARRPWDDIQHTLSLLVAMQHVGKAASR